MCGIIAVAANEDVVPFLLEGLARLEYRGYDSIGIALKAEDKIIRRRASGRLDQLKSLLQQKPAAGEVGIGHTRWATHGIPNEHNAHPHIGHYNGKKVALVHNGIIENFAQLKESLNVEFTSDTDSEVIVHLLAAELEKGTPAAIALRSVAAQLRGSFACALLLEGDPNLYGMSRGLPLVIGFGDDKGMIASDGLALAGWASKVCYLEDGDFVCINKTHATFTDIEGRTLTRNFEPLTLSAEMASKQGFDSFMKKEIYEHPKAVAAALDHYLAGDALKLPPLTRLEKVRHIVMIGCGGAIHAALVARYWIEKHAGIPTTVEIASEFRDRHVVIPDDTLLIFISQSGETADTLAAFRHCQRQGHAALAIVNQPQSTLMRSADFCLMMHAGVEIGVAATKSVTSQMTILALCTLSLSAMDSAQRLEHINALKALPDLMTQTLSLEPEFKRIAKEVLLSAKYILHLGRGAFFPIALEGALKSKEITYIPSEGYAAGEMKHGPIAMIDENTPVIALAPHNDLFPKMLSNLQEVHARGGKIILISDRKGIAEAGDFINHPIMMPDIHAFTAPILYVIPVQFISYYVAHLKGLDVDRPRNLAKSVTVE